MHMHSAGVVPVLLRSAAGNYVTPGRRLINLNPNPNPHAAISTLVSLRAHSASTTSRLG